MSVHHKELLSDYLRKRHSVTKLVVHLVFTTKYRRKLFDGYMIEQLREAFKSACEKLECDMLEMDGEEDHVHLLIAYPPKLAISIMVNNLKSVSSRRIRILNTHIPKLIIYKNLIIDHFLKRLRATSSFWTLKSWFD